MVEVHSSVCLAWSCAVAGVTSKKGEGAMCFLCDSIYVVVPGQLVVDLYA